ncbi:ABC transporter related protein [Clostridium carboxidivorans P7]|uniref:ABC transporter related protein n=1 Tax=Clostridium carboxidivorans P7 TaxID=536227 RepID=C6PUF6_9CLOT|nr:ATP-binding cassette domain-containing protein [Clostridium carboxidivorans]EET87154.1 ABC transporter related protein [Clostridium carboxidivorans P7]
MKIFEEENLDLYFKGIFLIDYMTVMQNVLTPINDDSKTSKAKAFSILNSFGIAHLADKKPHQLSVGQRQLTAIARALINDPKVIFADEPTAALDHTSAKKVINFLENYKKDTMIIIVTHDHSILKNADHVINMLDGTIESIDKERE